MKVFTNLTELIKRLYAERKLLNELFQARDHFDFRYEEALKFVENEKNLRLLIDYGVVRQEGEMLEMEEAYQHFFEEILNLNENITSSSVEENLHQLKNNIDFYLKERNNPEQQRNYVKKIMRTLRNISTQADTKTRELKRAINDVYRQERNYDIKRKKLEDYQSTLDNIATLIRETERMLDKRSDVLDVMTSDDRIKRLSLDTRIHFKQIFHTLIELEHIIRDYLHQIDAHNRLVKRIRKLKYLKDQLTWEKSTDVCEMIGNCGDMLIETVSNFSTRPSIAYLRDNDAGIEIIENARKSITKLRQIKVYPQVPLRADELDSGYLVEDFVDTDLIADSFFASSQDLYTFVKNYPFSRPKNAEQKVEYYTEIILNHHPRLLITNKWESDGNIDYPLIYNKP